MYFLELFYGQLLQQLINFICQLFPSTLLGKHNYNWSEDDYT